jgi:hypothetical protein
MSSQNKVAWTYTDDLGRNWRRAADKAITDQLNIGEQSKVGGAAAASSVLPFPTRRIKPRVALVTSPAHVLRRVVSYTNDSDMLTVGTTITLETGGADVTFTVYGTEGERSRNGIMNAS